MRPHCCWWAPGVQNTLFSASPITTCTDISFIPFSFFFFPATSSLLSLDDSRGLKISRQGLLWIQGGYRFYARQFTAGCSTTSWRLSTILYLVIYLSDYVKIQYLSQNFLLLCGATCVHFPASSPLSSPSIFKNFSHTYLMPFVLN